MSAHECLRVDPYICCRAVQAAIQQTSQRAIGPDPGRLLDYRSARARKHSREVAAMLGQRGGTLCAGQNCGCCCGARATAHRRRYLAAQYYAIIWELTGTGVAWPELLGALFQFSQSTDSGQRETAFRIFSATPGIIEKQHEDVVMTAFKGGFADSEPSVGMPTSTSMAGNSHLA